MAIVNAMPSFIFSWIALARNLRNVSSLTSLTPINVFVILLNMLNKIYKVFGVDRFYVLLIEGFL